MKYVFLYDGRGWYLEINSLDALNNYLQIVWDIRREELLRSIKRVKEGGHPVGDIMSACKTLADAKGSDIWTEYQKLKGKQSQDMSYMILKGMTIYVNSSGGYTTSLENIINRCESDVLSWPVFKEEDIRIKQWPGGVHYYAYIGPMQVKDQKTVKWGSESDARAAAMRYVNRKRPIR